MSRALILMAQSRFLQRPLTPEETAACLAAWAEIAAGQRVYIPEPAPVQGALLHDIADLRANGWSIRKIARKLRVSKSHVHRELSQISCLESGQTPA
jgi:hypothetical protein